MEIHGDWFLGGDDFDAEIVTMILNHVREKYKVDLSKDDRFRVIAKAEAEAAKKSLSNPSTDAINITVPDALTVAGKSITLRLKVSRDDFERAIGQYVRRCQQLVREALEHQSLTADDISDVLLVGGSRATSRPSSEVRSRLLGTSLAGRSPVRVLAYAGDQNEFGRWLRVLRTVALIHIESLLTLRHSPRRCYNSCAWLMGPRQR
jgi:actin-like ATPase involved in cell morphogenesis